MNQIRVPSATAARVALGMLGAMSAVAFALALPMHAGAAGNNYIVTTAQDDPTGVPSDCTANAQSKSCSLRDAIAAATASGDAITFAANIYDIFLSNTLVISSPQNMSITGPVTVDGGGKYQVFLVQSGATVRMNNLVITNGSNTSGCGGGIDNEGKLILNGATVSNSKAAKLGGGICNGAPPDNGSPPSGSATLSASNSAVTGNSAPHAGAVFSSGPASFYTTNLTSNATNNPASSGDGGAIYNYKAALTIGSTSVVSGNNAYVGGGLVNDNGNVTITSSTVSTNTAYDGAGINNDGALTLNYSTVSNNVARQDGGGICSGLNNTNAQLSDISNMISGNTATHAGGVFSAGSATLSGDTVKNNAANGGDGGGIYDYHNTLSVQNGSAIAANSADVGGGIVLDNGNVAGTVTVSASTIGGSSSTGNTAEYGGGGVYEYYGVLNLYNSSVTYNQAYNPDTKQYTYGGGVYRGVGVLNNSGSVIRYNKPTNVYPS